MKMTNEKDKDIQKNPQIFEIDILKKENKQTKTKNSWAKDEILNILN